MGGIKTDGSAGERMYGWMEEVEEERKRVGDEKWTTFSIFLYFLD